MSICKVECDLNLDPKATILLGDVNILVYPYKYEFKHSPHPHRG